MRGVLPKAAFCCAFLWAKGLSAKDIHLEISPVYSGKCLSGKAVHSWIEKFSEGSSKVTDDAQPGAHVAETTVRRLLCCWFRCTGKAMGPVQHYWWRICREIHFIQDRILHVLRFVSICDLFTVSPPYLQIQRASTAEVSNFQGFH
jgi:hypothetical protein